MSTTDWFRSTRWAVTRLSSASTADEFHRFSQMRQARWPLALSPLSTHDTKRSEDVRATDQRAFARFHEEWFERVERWRRWNAVIGVSVDDLVAPDANEEYLLYQTLVGAWPLELAELRVPREFVERIQNYMVKAGHEAKRHSSWINPDPDYDDAIRAFVGLILDERSGQPFLDDFRAFQAQGQPFWPSRIRSARRCSSWLLPASPTRFRDPSSGTSAWLTPTTAGRSTMRFAGADARRPEARDRERARRPDAIMPGARRRARTTAGSSSFSITVPFVLAATTPDFSRPAIIVRWKSKAQSRPTCSRSHAGAARPEPSSRHPGSGPDCLRINRTQAELNGARSWHPARRGSPKLGARLRTTIAGFRELRGTGNQLGGHLRHAERRRTVLGMAQRFHRRGSHCRGR